MILKIAYSEQQLRQLIAKYEAGMQPEVDTERLLWAASVALAHLDEARTSCVTLAGRLQRERDTHRRVSPELLVEIRESIKRALEEPHDIATDRLIDAVTGIVEHLEGGRPQPKEGV